MATKSIDLKLTKVKKRACRKFVLSFTQFALSMVILISFLLVLTQIIQPILNEVKNSQQLLKNFNRIIDNFQNITINDLFSTNSEGYFQVPENIASMKPEDAAKILNPVFTEFQKDFERIFNELKTIDPDKIVTQSKDIIKEVLDVLPQVGEKVGIELGEKSKEIIQQVNNLDNLVSNVDRLVSSWLNISFDKILSIFANNTGTNDWQAVIKENVGTLLKSKLAIMLIVDIVALVLILLLTIWLIISAFKIKVTNWRLSPEVKIGNWATTLNIFLSFVFILNFISWWIINKLFKIKLNRYQKQLASEAKQKMQKSQTLEIKSKD